MFSFHVPVTALEKQQSRLELLGENIANVNTTGYKTQRMTFIETLGTVTGISQTEFKQGSITYTGISTDLAISGNSFFVIKRGEDQVYTRAGAFSINNEGKLVNVDGFVVQGYMENISQNGAAQGTQALGDIIIDSNLVMAAQATENVWLSGNLNAGLESIAEIWTSGSAFSLKANLVSSGITFPLTVAEDVNDQFTISLNPKYTESVTEELTLSAGNYANLDDLVAEINNQISTNQNLTGEVEAVNDNGSLKIRATDGLSGTILTLNSGTNDVLADLGFSDGDSATSGVVATEATKINDLLQISTDLVDGDKFNISGKTCTGDSVAKTFTFGSSNDGITLGGLMDVINDGWSGSSIAEIVDGKITLTDIERGDSSTTISLNADSENVGQITVPSFVNDTAGSTGRVTSSIMVYDSLGKSHNLTIDFVKTEDEGTWAWTITGTGNEEIVRGGSGRAVFDASGNFLSFVYDGGVDAVTIDPQNGSNELVIRVSGEATDGFTGLSQYDSVSTMYARDQDGRASETLSSFFVDSDGSIIGSFGTGEELKLAQIALAQFKDPAGLQKTGGSNYVATSESGIAHIGSPESQNSTIEASSLELSTVDLADQFTKMIEAQRAYQAASKVISTFEEIFDQTAQLKR
jgi:flagellar hook protein FlgE